MLAGSYMVIARKHSEIGVGALLAVVVSQALGYGLILDINFFFRLIPPCLIQGLGQKLECYWRLVDGAFGFPSSS
jgi:hypothetical protein